MKHFWIVFIAITFVNGFILKFKSKKYIAENPELEAGYDKLFKGFIIFVNIPWVIMGIGNLIGSTKSIFAYFRPRELNPMVLVFHTSIIVLWVLSVRWIYFQNGAEFLEQHPGLLKKSSFSGNTNVTAKQIKLFFPIMLLGGIIGMIMMWFMPFPVAPR